MFKISQTVDVVQVQKMSTKAKNPCRCSKFSLNKNFKLTLDQNVTSHTYPKISCRFQKCSVWMINQQFYEVNLILFSNFSSFLHYASIPRENVSFFILLSKEYQAKFSRTLEYRLVICLHRLIVNSVGTTKVFPADFYGRHFDE